MWFNPGDLLKNKTAHLANPANPANYELKSSETETPISKLAGLARCMESHKDKIIAELKAEQYREGLKAEQAANDIIQKLVVTCYTPNGKPIAVEATSPEHAEFLQQMNPKPKGIHQ